MGYTCTIQEEAVATLAGLREALGARLDETLQDAILRLKQDSECYKDLCSWYKKVEGAVYFDVPEEERDDDRLLYEIRKVVRQAKALEGKLDAIRESVSRHV